MGKPLSNDIEITCNNLATNRVLKKGQTKVNTAILFDASLRFFALHKDSFSDLNNQIKGMLAKYGINAGLFNEGYDSLFTPSDPLPLSTDVELDADSQNVMEILHMKAMNEKEQQQMPDFVAQLFMNKTYTLYSVFKRCSEILKERYDAAVDAGTAEEDLPQNSFDVELFYADMQGMLIKKSAKEIKSLESGGMEKFLTNINKYVASRNDLKLVGMEKELLALEVALCGRTKKSAVLVGKAGVGKTSLIYEFAKRINENNVPTPLQGTIIYELHMDALVAGSMFRGQFEERLKNVLDAVSKLKNVILFIDEFHTMVSAGASSSDGGGDQSGGNIMKPYLSRGDIWVVGATTDDEYNEYVEKDKAISRRFKKVHLVEPNKAETIEIMRGVLELNEKFFEKHMEEELLDKIYSLSQQYNIHSANPDRALTMLESAFAYAKVCKENDKEVIIDDMIKALELQYNLIISETKSEDTRKAAKEFLLGQDEPIDNVCKYLNMIDMNIVDPLKPKCSLLFGGPTGVGKTEMAKIIAKTYTGSENNLITVSCATLQHEGSETSIFGSAPGYVGYKQTSDFLAKIKQTPNAVVLFDEIEKAHPNIFKSLLGMLDEGMVQDTGGNNISFRNCIIIFTTNKGFGDSNYSGGGIMRTTTSAASSITAINKHFSPEFIGRLDEVIIFNRLGNDIAERLIERYRSKYEELSGVKVKFTKKEIEDIIDKANIVTLGARNLEHVTKVAFTEKVMKSSNKQ